MKNNKQKACLALVLYFGTKRFVNRKRWMKEWLQKRTEYTHINLLNEILLTDPSDYHNYFRMDVDTYNFLEKLVAPHLIRCNTILRNCISVKERLAVTLRYLATGRYFEDLKFSAIMSPSSISYAVLETCEVIVKVLQKYIEFPRNSKKWKEIANEFGLKTQFWNCIGAIDGKHIAIKKPTNSGSMYFNYKGFYSIVLLAVVDANKKFVMIDVGINGRISDGGVMYYSKFGELFEQKALNLPNPAPIPNTPETFPYVFVADEAFSLNTNLMKPYSMKSPLTSENIEYNKRLSRARVVVENAFGILATRFGVLQKPICLEPKKATSIVMACCYLHNFLATHNTNTYFIQNVCNSPNTSAGTLTQLKGSFHRNSSCRAKDIRDKFCKYFNNEGKM